MRKIIILLICLGIITLGSTAMAIESNDIQKELRTEIISCIETLQEIDKHFGNEFIKSLPLIKMDLQDGSKPLSDIKKDLIGLKNLLEIYEMQINRGLSYIEMSMRYEK